MRSRSEEVMTERKKQKFHGLGRQTCFLLSVNSSHLVVSARNAVLRNWVMANLGLAGMGTVTV